MATTTERISLSKFAAAIGLAAEQVKDFMAPIDVACGLIAYCPHDAMPIISDPYGEPNQRAVVRRVIAMLEDENHQDWDR